MFIAEQQALGVAFGTMLIVFYLNLLYMMGLRSAKDGLIGLAAILLPASLASYVWNALPDFPESGYSSSCNEPADGHDHYHGRRH